MDRTRSERGAITIHVAISLIALLMFAGMVIDQGPFYIARRQAQNAADAGALAGAIELMYFGTNSSATANAQTITSQHAIWGEATALADIQVSPLPFNCPDGVPSCIRVDVMRGQPDRAGGVHTNTFPTFLVRMFGPTAQGVRATATAQIAAGNSVQCIKPWVVADKWTDNSTGASGGLTSGAWDQMDTFDPAVDTYPGLGFSAETDIGLQLMLKGEGHDFSSGWNLEVDLNGGNGGSVYNAEIEGCPEWIPTVGLYDGSTTCTENPDHINYEKGCLNVKTGVKNGPTIDGVHNLVSLDTGASWDTTNNTVTGGCTTTGDCQTVNPLGIPISPRIVPIALFSPSAYAAGGFTGNGGMARVMNLLGFFIEGMCDEVYPTPPAWCGTGADPGKTVVGRLMRYPGQGSGASGSAGPATFLRMVRLIR
jgi:Putative Flp pilus-assembly TadE/G-like